MNCLFTKKNCLICSELHKKWRIDAIIKSLEEAKGKLDYFDLPDLTIKKVNFKSKPLTEKEKCALNLLLDGKTVKEIALYFNVSYNYLRNWLSKTLYSYFKILAQDFNYSFPNNQFNFSSFIQLLEKKNYLQESYLLSEVKQTLGNVNMVLNYVGQEKKDGILKPKFTVSFNLEMQCFSSDIIEQIVTTINVMSLDDRWIIVANNVLDKKIIIAKDRRQRAFSRRRIVNIKGFYQSEGILCPSVLVNYYSFFYPSVFVLYIK